MRLLRRTSSRSPVLGPRTRQVPLPDRLLKVPVAPPRLSRLPSGGMPATRRPPSRSPFLSSPGDSMADTWTPEERRSMRPVLLGNSDATPGESRGSPFNEISRCGRVDAPSRRAVTTWPSNIPLGEPPTAARIARLPLADRRLPLSRVMPQCPHHTPHAARHTCPRPCHRQPPAARNAPLTASRAEATQPRPDRAPSRAGDHQHSTAPHLIARDSRCQDAADAARD